jgi:lipid-A-disaccharide synthase
MAAELLSLFVLAGEPSGDRIAADLVRRLRAHAPVVVTGVGGSELEAEELASLYPMSDLSVMGFAVVLRRLPLLLWRARQTVRAILAIQPDVVVLVDAQVFSATIARRLRRAGYRGVVLLYVAPAVWAWKPERAPGLKSLFDEILAVLPFEPAAMARLGGPRTTYVGHPALARLPFRDRLPSTGPLLLLPGSRSGEIVRNLDMMQEVARSLRAHPRLEGFLLPTTARSHRAITEAVAGWEVPVRVVSSEEGKRAAFEQALAAVAVTGTVTLELALAGVPMVTTYVADAGQAKRFARYKVKFAALPNIVLDREVVPELLFTTPDAAKLAAATLILLDDRDVAGAQLAAFRELRALMEQGAPGAPRADPAETVLGRLAPSYRSMIGT